MNDLYLAHHGIKGMKWGVRRYQNSDGSLTSAGKKRRYGDKFIKKDGALTRSGIKKQQKIDRTINRAQDWKKTKEEELRELNKNISLYNNPAKKKEATNHAMKTDYGNDYRKVKYLEEVMGMKYSDLQKQSYEEHKKYYSNPDKRRREAEKDLQYTVKWLNKYGNAKISDISTKEEYKKIASLLNRDYIWGGE